MDGFNAHSAATGAATHLEPLFDISSCAKTGNQSALSSLQELQVDGFNAHPAATDAATHLGALFDTDAGSAAKIPVGLGAYCVPCAGQVCI